MAAFSSFQRAAYPSLWDRGINASLSPRNVFAACPLFRKSTQLEKGSVALGG